MGRKTIKFLLINILSSMLTMQVGHAASLQVSPTTVNFADNQQAQSVWLTNSGNAPIRAQVRLLGWQQQNGKDQLTPTQTLVATPPIIDIPAGQKQLVRLVFPNKQADNSATEQAYRLLVNELPTTTSHAKGLQFLLSYSIPVFIAKKNTTTTSPLTKTGFNVENQTGKTLFSIDNQNNQHIKISKLTFTPTSGKSITVTPGLLGYALAGEKMQWPISLSATTLKNGGVFSAMVNNDTQLQTLLSYRR